MKKFKLLAIVAVAVLCAAMFTGCDTASVKEGTLSELFTVGIVYGQNSAILEDETLRAEYATIKSLDEEPNPNTGSIVIREYHGTDELGQPVTFSSTTYATRLSNGWVKTETTMHYNDITVEQTYSVSADGKQHDDGVYYYTINGTKYKFPEEMFNSEK